MTVVQIAKKLKTSTSNVKRSCRGTRFYAHNGKYKFRPQLVRQVLEYYFEHGLTATADAFPKVCVRSITDRPEYYGVTRVHRQIRWTNDQHLEAVRMAGIIPLAAQARYFGRPGAHLGAMKSFWMKRVKMGGGTLHGMAEWNAKHIVTDRCPRLKTQMWRTREGKHRSGKERSLVLWIDAEKHLRPGTPLFIAEGIRALAQFTRIVFGVKNPKRKILRMIEERV